MRTKEFIKRVEELGYGVDKSLNSIDIIENETGYIICVISRRQLYSICIGEHLAIETLRSRITKELFKLITEYAKTPIEEREEEKKYYYRHRWAKTKNGNWMYLALRQRPSISYLTLQGSDKDIFEYQVRFTCAEIEAIKEKYNADLSDFEIVEVEE